MLIETIKNHPRRWSEETLKMASLPGHAKWICQEYVHWVQSAGWSTPDGFIAVILWSSLTFLSLLSILTSPLPAICFYDPQSTSSCYSKRLKIFKIALIIILQLEKYKFQIIYIITFQYVSTATCIHFQFVIQKVVLQKQDILSNIYQLLWYM